jgi:mRNA interferase MazF
MAKQKIAFPKRGEIYLLNFDPTIGSEIQKTILALILQNDISNQYRPITIVVAIIAKCDYETYPTEVSINSREGGLAVISVILLNQIRSIDKQHLVKRMGIVSNHIMRYLDNAIQSKASPISHTISL